MDININKQNFDRLVDSLTRKERLLIATELCVASDSRLSSPLIPGALISEIVKVRTRILVKRKVSTWSLWKLWVFAMKPEGDLKNWRMTTNQCYRLRPRQRSVTGNLYRKDLAPVNDEACDQEYMTAMAMLCHDVGWIDLLPT